MVEPTRREQCRPAAFLRLSVAKAQSLCPVRGLGHAQPDLSGVGDDGDGGLPCPAERRQRRQNCRLIGENDGRD